VATISMAVFCRQQYKPTGFAVPLMPFLPSISLCLNSFLLATIPAAAWIQFAYFMAAMFGFYILYSVHAATHADHVYAAPRFCPQPGQGMGDLSGDMPSRPVLKPGLTLLPDVKSSLGRLCSLMKPLAGDGVRIRSHHHQLSCAKIWSHIRKCLLKAVQRTVLSQHKHVSAGSPASSPNSNGFTAGPAGSTEQCLRSQCSSIDSEEVLCGQTLQLKRCSAEEVR
jgi:hypothetical protein